MATPPQKVDKITTLARTEFKDKYKPVVE